MCIVYAHDISAQHARVTKTHMHYIHADGTLRRRRYNMIPISWISIQLFPRSSPPPRRSFSHPISPHGLLLSAPWGYLWRKSTPVLLQEEAAGCQIMFTEDEQEHKGRGEGQAAGFSTGLLPVFSR
jgi:hypothetical protein